MYPSVKRARADDFHGKVCLLFFILAGSVIVEKTFILYTYATALLHNYPMTKKHEFSS
jgi:hypothetical protein